MNSFTSLLLLLVAGFAVGQQTHPAPTAKPEDVKSIDTICKAVYDVISGPPGAKHEWDRMRSLFTPDARMIAVGKTQDGKLKCGTFSVEDYIKLSGRFIEKNGFQEKELAHRTEQFADMAHVFSTYESHYKVGGKDTTERGINSIQLWYDGTRWWIVTIYWQDESTGVKLPEKYFHDG